MATGKKTRLKSKVSRKKSSGGGTTPYIFGACMAIALIAAGFYWMNETRTAMAVDPDTLCPVAAGPVAETVLLFDVTDPMSAAQGHQLLQYLEREFANAPVGTQFTMGVVSENIADWGATAPLCRPRSEKDVSALNQNVLMVQQRYEERFIGPLRDNLNRMLSASGANTSPIMEALQALIADTPGFLTFTGPRKVIFVSDLLQNSDAMSFYRGDDWQSFAASPAFQRLGRTLNGVAVDIYGVPRTGTKIRDPSAVEDFWLRYFNVQGAELPNFQNLGDL